MVVLCEHFFNRIEFARDVAKPVAGGPEHTFWVSCILNKFIFVQKKTINIHRGQSTFVQVVKLYVLYKAGENDHFQVNYCVLLCTRSVQEKRWSIIIYNLNLSLTSTHLVTVNYLMSIQR